MIRTTLLAAASAAAFALPALADHHMEAKSIPETAAAAGEFDTLLAAVEAAGLAETLSGDGPFTVFAPTDDAFAALPEGTVEELLMPENKDKLVQILTYHVLPGAVMSGDISGEMMPETVQGSALTVMPTEDDGVMVNDATVIQADIEASNGVIHAIDTVLMPEG
ncbi:fasciclin domain-containing protein [Mangrovicoccus algicola]|uniref:Fasciclin domain-containing protein n=1 Tax=Mangrovicoccus algicola TaxID=2771008 RepID=A0A8J7D1B9_9RHOB|nr:fasciclin domain-containing protein [Mangrovicoccus algicola]MBE3640603.1 fasciclin domain-containing protein [Mangrovicoccus algicola]